MSNRRHFLKQSALVSLSPWLPAFLPRSLSAADAKSDERILVVLQLDGGNDGLNTVIPYADENYAKVRTELRIPQKSVKKLDDSIGLHPAMKSAAMMFEDGRLSIVQGVGFPNPNRSHFESMAIWQHSPRLDAREHDSIGWLRGAVDVAGAAASGAPDAIYVGSDATPVAVRGRRANAVALNDESDLKLTAAENVVVVPPVTGAAKSAKSSELSGFVERTVHQSYAAAQQFANADAGGLDSAVRYPSNNLGRKLALVSKLIKQGGGTRIYYVSQSGYDTHSAQLYPHYQLLDEFSRSMQAFMDDLRGAKLEDRVALMAFSEFGRRVQENGSAGTDHGVAGPVFLAGGKLRGGIVGNHPSLTDLDEGDLKTAFDFRQVYATLLADWLNVNPVPVLGEFSQLNLFS